jgi:hypothetical protein
MAPKKMEANMPEGLRMLIEQTAMKIIDAKRKEARITIDDLAKALYPDKPIASGRMMIQRLRKAQGEKPPRKMNLGEFVELARAVNINPLQTLGAVLQEIDDTKI